MGDSQLEKLLDDIMESDERFYEKYLSNLSIQELQEFLEKNPDFLQD